MPGVDPAHIHRAFRAGLLGAQHEGIAQAQFLRDRECGHVTELGIAIQFGARPGHHAGQVLHVFHGAKQVAEVLHVRLVTADVDECDVGEFFGDGRHRIHVAEGRAQDQVEALAGQAAEHLLRVSAFRNIFNVGDMHIRHVLLDVDQALVVGL